MPLSFRPQRCAQVLLMVAGLGMGWGTSALAEDNLTTATPPSAPSVAAAPVQGSAPDASASSANPALKSISTAQLGREYARLDPPVRTGSPRTVDVTVFTLYACGPCAEANGVLQKWADALPYFVHVQNSPAVLNPHWSYLARVFFALDAIGQERSQRASLFRAINQEGMNYADFHQMERWLDNRGVSLPAFEKAFDSNDVIALTANAPSVMRMYHVVSVPTVVVDGRYIVTAASAGGIDKLPGVLNDVVARAAQDKGLIR